MPERRIRLVSHQNESQGRDRPGPLDKALFERRIKIIPWQDLLHARWSVSGMAKVLYVGNDNCMGLVFITNYAADRFSQIIHP